MRDVLHGMRAGAVLEQKVFTARGATGTASGWEPWIKPRNARMVMIVCIGAGAGGGGGHTAAAGTARGGGGGGGCGAISRVLLPAIFLPDTLFVLAGAGGAGGTAAGAGSAGTRSYVSMVPGDRKSVV